MTTASVNETRATAPATELARSTARRTCPSARCRSAAHAAMAESASVHTANQAGDPVSERTTVGTQSAPSWPELLSTQAV